MRNDLQRLVVAGSILLVVPEGISEEEAAIWAAYVERLEDQASEEARVAEADEPSMEFVGYIDSEPMMAGYLPDGRRIYVHQLAHYEDAPAAVRGIPAYWQYRYNSGQFADSENSPLVWIEK